MALRHTGQLRPVLRGWRAYSRPESSFTVTLPLSAAKADSLCEDAYIPPHTLSSCDVHPVVKYYLTHFDPLSGMHSYE